MQQSKEIFENIGQQVDIIAVIKEEIKSVKTHLENTSDALDNVTLLNLDAESIPSIEIALNRMSVISETAYQTSRTCHHRLNVTIDEYCRDIASPRLISYVLFFTL